MPKKRVYAYDFMRAIAIIMVVAVHCIPEGQSDAALVYSAFMKALLVPCNAVFFLLSGMFNLKSAYLDKLPHYYYRKIRNILVPALIYMLINTIYDAVKQPGPLQPERVLPSFFVNAFSLYSNGIFWFVMAIFGMLLIAPFFAQSFEHMNKRSAQSLFIVFIIFSGLNLIGVWSGSGFGWSWPIAAFFTLFLLGPAVSRIKVPHRMYPLLSFGACVAISTVLILCGVPHHPVNDNTPFYFIAGISLFILLQLFGSRMKENRVISLLSKYSFSIYMCHLMVLPFVAAIVPPMTKPLAQLIMTAITLAGALAASLAIDNLLVHPAQRLLDKAFSHARQNVQADASSPRQ